MLKSVDYCDRSDANDWMPGSEAAAKRQKISVLLGPEEADRFEAYCTERGFKKSTLIARLIREHLDRERFGMQGRLFDYRGEEP
ncbi:MAG: hypothetical protein ACREFQ_06075 [Stellaceae bacterium]